MCVCITVCVSRLLNQALIHTVPSRPLAQVLVPGRGGHVHGGGPAAGRRPALPPPAERAVHRGRRQTLPLRDDPGAGLPAEPAHHTQVR